MGESKTIIYIAPEVPSRTATFVYNEVLSLKQCNIKILPVTLHRIDMQNSSQTIQEISQDTYLLYNKEIWPIVKSFFYVAYHEPALLIKTLLIFCIDLFQSISKPIISVKLTYQFLHSFKIAYLAQQEKCKHIHAHFATAPLPIAMYASLLTSIPFSITTHAVDIFACENINLRYLNRAKAVITISNFNKKYLISKGVLPDKINVIRCGIDTSKFEFRPKTQFKQSIRLGTLCRLISKKGVDNLIESVAILKSKGINCNCEVAGDGALKDELIKKAKMLGIESCISFVGSLDHEKVDHWLQGIDIFVLAAKVSDDGDQDGIPIALMEAMAVGTPVISTHVSGIPELIDHGINGFLAHPGDANSLAKNIHYLISNTDLLPQILESARAKVVSEFNQEKAVSSLVQMFT